MMTMIRERKIDHPLMRLFANVIAKIDARKLVLFLRNKDDEQYAKRDKTTTGNTDGHKEEATMVILWME